MLGHAKTVLVLLGGWTIFQEVISLKQLAGMAIAVAGMVWYGAESSKVAAAAPAAPRRTKDGEGEQLLGDRDEPAEKKETV